MSSSPTIRRMGILDRLRGRPRRRGRDLNEFAADVRRAAEMIAGLFTSVDDSYFPTGVGQTPEGSLVHFQPKAPFTEPQGGDLASWTSESIRQWLERGLPKEVTSRHLNLVGIVVGLSEDGTNPVHDHVGVAAASRNELQLWMAPLLRVAWRLPFMRPTLLAGPPRCFWASTSARIPINRRWRSGVGNRTPTRLAVSPSHCCGILARPRPLFDFRGR